MIIDTRGRACPEPLVMTKRAISAATDGGSFEILSDNTTARNNLMSYLSSLGIDAQCTSINDIFHICFTIGEEQVDQSKHIPVDDKCGCGDSFMQKYAVVVRSRLMGAGDDDLGALLMRSCINSLGDLDRLPAVVVLYNSGVMLAVEGTDTAGSFIALRDRGVEIIVCGTCIDYFGIKDRLAVGTISNMLTINNTLAQVGHIIYP